MEQSELNIREMTDKQRAVLKLRGQNDNLKNELKMLSQKLEDFVQMSRSKRNQQNHQYSQPTGLPPAPNPGIQPDPLIQQKERELRECQRKIQYYKREIDHMRSQLEGSYNIQKIMALENEEAHKKNLLKQLQ